MKVICILPTLIALTLNKQYETIIGEIVLTELNLGELPDYYHIIDDNGRERVVLKICFVTLEEHRNTKLSNILT